MSKNERCRFRLQVGGLTPGAENKLSPRSYRAQLVRAGRVRAAGNRPGPVALAPGAISGAVSRGLLEYLPAFVDHPGPGEHASLGRMAGMAVNSRWDPQAGVAEGVIRLYPTPAGELMRVLFDAILQDTAAGIEPPDVGLSLVFWPQSWQEPAGPDEPLTITAIRHVESVDFVFEPAAEGRIRAALSAQQMEWVDSLFNQGERHMEDSNRENGLGPAGAAAWSEALRRTAVPAMLAGSGLPRATQELLAGQEWAEPAELERAIEQHRQHLAALAEAQVVNVGGLAPRQTHVSLGRNSLEQITLAAEALIAGNRPGDNVQPLTGIRELYHLLSGDYEMNGVFQPERIRFANVSSSTMAGLVANALNKRVINLFQEYPQWWAPIVASEDFQSLQTVRWITLGGVGELPTVAEGAAYTELTWDDSSETTSFVKKGGYLGITLEAIDKDDTAKLRAAPRALAQAAWLTLSKAVSNIFTANSGVGPTLSDGGALFNATATSTPSGHANLLTSALSFTAYKAVRAAMRKQTELGSGEPLSALTAPKYLLVPPDLEITALQVLGSEYDPGEGTTTSYQAANPFAEGDGHQARMNAARGRVIVVDLWSDTDNWAAVADPKLYPSIGLGFRYGRSPEVYSVASPTAGLMFTNDTMPVKVRFFFAVGPTDFRGLHKNNV